MKPSQAVCLQAVITVLTLLIVTPANADNYIRSYLINNTPISVCGIQPNSKAKLDQVVKGSTINELHDCSLDGIDTKLTFLMKQGIPSIGISTPQNCIPTATTSTLRTMTIIARDSDFKLSTQIKGDEIDFSVSFASINNFQMTQ